jgi:DNA-binding GntR family transcriptional regulator
MAKSSASARVVQSIREDIAAGRLKVGDRLPTRAQMHEKYGIAAMTAARVVATLVQEGLVESDVGRGVFVKATPNDADLPPDPLKLLEARVRSLEERLSKLAAGQ